MKFLTLLAIMLLATVPQIVVGDESNHEYASDEEVTLWVNKVGPYHNPQETYRYNSLPFCTPDKEKEIKYKTDGLGAALEGNELKDSGIHLKFRVDENDVEICSKTLTQEDAGVFQKAIKNHYWYQLYMDELPVFGMVGQIMKERDSSKPSPFLFTHKVFSVAYNGNRIIEVNLTSTQPVKVTPNAQISMKYSIVWKEDTSKSFERRFDRYLDFNFFEHQIHWFSIFNSFMMVVFLCGLVALILMRTIKNDYIRYTNDEDDLELDRVIDESGWKQVHGDVFRAPSSMMLFSALIGTGYQLFFLAFLCIGLAISSSLYMGRGRILSTFLSMYSFTSCIAGYAGGGYYKRNNGKDWKLQMALTTILFPGLCFGILVVLNFVAVGYQTLAAISVGTVAWLLAIWAFISVPLTVIGTVVGRNMSQVDDFPCRVNSSRRPIPDGKWYTNRLVLSLAGGVLPFGSIFIEMYFVFTSFWNYKFYYVYGFMLLVYIILIVVTVCVTIVSTYVLLNAEDYRWQWTCFLSAGSTAFYVFLYAVYYFFTKTRMYGFFQICFYFGYTAIFCLGMFVLCGTIGFMGTNLFVRKIYQYIKSD